MGFFSEFFGISGCDADSERIFAEITGDRARQPAYKIKLMLSRVSRALAQISFYFVFELGARTVQRDRRTDGRTGKTRYADYQDSRIIKNLQNSIANVSC